MKQLIIFLLMALSFEASAKYKVYQCNSIIDVLNCASSCKETPLIQYDFILNEEEGAIVQQVYELDRLINSIHHENCRFDEGKNWKCKLKNTYDSVSIGMNQQFFYQYSSDISKPSKLLCAKP